MCQIFETYSNTKCQNHKNTQAARLLRHSSLPTCIQFTQVCIVTVVVGERCQIEGVRFPWLPPCFFTSRVCPVCRMEVCPFARAKRNWRHLWNRAPYSISNLPKTICHFPLCLHNNRNKEKDSLLPACHKQQNAESEVFLFPCLT